MAVYEGFADRFWQCSSIDYRKVKNLGHDVYILPRERPTFNRQTGERIV